jgi:hypothetical protein
LNYWQIERKGSRTPAIAVRLSIPSNSGGDRHLTCFCCGVGRVCCLTDPEAVLGAPPHNPRVSGTAATCPRRRRRSSQDTRSDTGTVDLTSKSSSSRASGRYTGLEGTEERQELGHRQCRTRICEKSISNLAGTSEQYRSVSDASYDAPKKGLRDIDIDSFIIYGGFPQLGATLPKGYVLILQVILSKRVLPFHVAYGKQTRTYTGDWWGRTGEGTSKRDSPRSVLLPVLRSPRDSAHCDGTINSSMVVVPSSPIAARALRSILTT